MRPPWAPRPHDGDPSDHDPDDAHTPGGVADSAGVPWAGRAFEPNAAADDDGSADPRLIEALHRFRARELGQSDVIDALRTARLLVPLLAEAGETGIAPSGHTVDKSQELSIVTVSAPDGRRALPAFTSVATLTAWNPVARPVPAAAVRVALAAGHDGTDLVVIDPTTPTEFALRRSALRALATGSPWHPPADDARVLASIDRGTAEELDVLAARPLPGDPDARLAGPEVIVALVLREGLTPEARVGVLARLSTRWAEEEPLSDLVDSLALSVVAG